MERLPAGGQLTGARSFWRAEAASVRLAPGSFRVRLDQPDGLLARAVLEPHTPMPDAFLAEEREHLERQKGTRTYDVTGWSPLLAAGLDAWWSPALDSLGWEPVAGEVIPPPGSVREGAARYGWVFDGGTDAALALASLLVGKEVLLRVGEKPFELQGHAFPRGSFLVRAEENGPSAGYILKKHAAASGVEVFPAASARITVGPDLGGEHWILLDAPRVAIAAGFPASTTSVGWAWHLLDREVGTRTSLIDVTALANLDLARYNVIVLPDAYGEGAVYRRAIGDEGLKALRTWIEAGGTLVAVGAGADFAADAATKGPAGAGPDKLSQVKLRRQALKDFPPPRFGLDDQAVRAVERLQATGLGPDGRAVTSSGLYAEKDWPRALGIPGPGSPVIGAGAAAYLGLPPRPPRSPGATASPSGAPRARPASADAEAQNASARKKPAAKAAAADAGGAKEPERSEEEQAAEREKADARLRRFLPGGAIVRVDLDPEQWLSFGVGERVAVMTRGEDALIARDPVATAGRYAAPDQLHLGGLLWPEGAGRMSQTAYLTREAVGRGQVVLFAGDPNFRGYFWGSERLFLNAVVIGPGAGTRRPVPW